MSSAFVCNFSDTKRQKFVQQRNYRQLTNNKPILQTTRKTSIENGSQIDGVAALSRPHALYCATVAGLCHTALPPRRASILQLMTNQ